MEEMIKSMNNKEEYVKELRETINKIQKIRGISDDRKEAIFEIAKDIYDVFMKYEENKSKYKLGFGSCGDNYIEIDFYSHKQKRINFSCNKDSFEIIHMKDIFIIIIENIGYGDFFVIRRLYIEEVKDNNNTFKCVEKHLKFRISEAIPITNYARSSVCSDIYDEDYRHEAVYFEEDMNRILRNRNLIE